MLLRLQRVIRPRPLVAIPWLLVKRPMLLQKVLMQQVFRRRPRPPMPSLLDHLVNLAVKMLLQLASSLPLFNIIQRPWEVVLRLLE